MGCTIEHNNYNQVLEINNQKLIVNGEILNEKTKQVISGTLFENLKKSIKNFDVKSFLFYRKETENGYLNVYDSFSFYETFKMAGCLAMNLRSISDKKDLDVQILQENTFKNYGPINIIGIFSINCPEYVITDLACQSKNITTCILPDHYPEEFYKYAISQTEMKSIFVSPDYINKFLSLNSSISTIKKFVKNVIVYNLTKFVSKDQIKSLTDAGFNVLLFTDLMKKPDVNLIENEESLNENSIVTVCYSMGVEEYRGSMISNKGLVNQLNLLEEIGVKLEENRKENERFFSFLPISHIIERIHLYLAIKNGIEFYFISQSDIKKVFFEDIKLAKPTYLLTTPNYLLDINKRLIEHFDTFQGNDKSLLEEALTTKRRDFLETKRLKHVYYDRHAFNDIRMSFGGEVKAFISCLAHLPKDICLDMKVFLGIPIVELYTLTECSGVALHTNIDDLDNKTCGGVKKGLQLKFISENTKDLGGEICFKSDFSFLGYFRNNDLTQTIIDNEGWIHTGDTGELNNEDMGVKILGIKKEFFKLTTGKNISPRYLESIYMNTFMVNQIALFPCNRNLIIKAIAVLNIKFASDYLKSINVTNAKTDEELVIKNLKNEHLISKVLKELNKVANEKDLSSEERIYKVLLITDPFTQSNNLLSSFNIINREKVFEKYSEQLNKLK